MRKVFSTNKKYFGKSVLDIGAGGGLLGIAIKDRIKNYLGIDINPDVVKAARPALEKESLDLILGDVREIKITGKYDTVVMIGNVLGHLTVDQFVEALTNIQSAVERKAHFIIEYRDWIGMCYNKEWITIYKSKDGITVTEGINTETGEVEITKIEYTNRKPIKYTHTIWAPFILETIMKTFGWRLVKRTREPAWGGWFDIYERTNK